MNKEVKYNGYSAQPSDYECQDGELAVAINLINEDGHLSATPNPLEYPINMTGYTALIIHKVPQQKNLILLLEEPLHTYRLAWIPLDDIEISSDIVPEIIAPDSEPLYGYKSIAIIGNTICVVDNISGPAYYIWRDGKYHIIGNYPPFLDIAFKAVFGGFPESYSSTTQYELADVPTMVQRTFGTLTDDRVHNTGDPRGFWENHISNQVLGLLLSTGRKIMEGGSIYQPCFIRYAFKFYDGSYSYHSAPVLIGITDSVPALSGSANENNGLFSLQYTTQFKKADIRYQILYAANLEPWKDIITGIDVFMSAPLYTFDQSSIGYGLTSLEGLKLNYKVGGNRKSGRTDDEVAEDESRSPSDRIYFDLARKDSLADDICSESNFYKIASFELEDIAEMTKFENLPLIDKDLTNLVTRERLPDDYNSHASIRPDNCDAYNNRLFLSGIKIRPPRPFPLSDSVEAIDNQWGTYPDIPIDATQWIYVRTLINGVKCRTQKELSIGSVHYYPVEKKFPRFIYHPDPNAYSMFILHPANNKIYEIPLKRHPLLNGAYWFHGFDDKPQGVIEKNLEYSSITVLTSFLRNEAPWRNDSTRPVSVGGTVYVSLVNNPFVFPSANAVSIDASNIMGLSTAAKALSQGQFGQFPLYAFTDTGVWAMEISSTGTITARQPLTRDVCISPHGITQLDSAVLFPTDRGIMLISGSDVKCISDPINNIEPFRLADFTAFQSLLDNINPVASQQISEFVPLRQFLNDKLRIVYDYVHQRIIVYHPDYLYSYTYSLKSKLWGMLAYGISDSLNSYPEALAINSAGQLVNLSKIDYSSPNPISVLLTRPLKLDAPNIHKTIDNIIQRGNFAKGHVQSVLYGSRDLINWHLVWSSKDHFLRGFRGTPYKYFRVALLCNLSPGESIYGASVQFTPRLTNQPR